MRLTVLGSSGSYATADRPSSGYLVTTGSTTVLLDLGFGVFSALGDQIPDAIVLSHVHPDHCADLLALYHATRYGAGEEAPIPVMAPAGLKERFAAFLDADDDHGLFEVFAFDLVAGGDERTVGDLSLRFGDATHPVPALVTRVEGEGRSLVYSGDTGPGGDLEALAAGADVLLCEASLQGEPSEDRYPYHLFAVEAGDLAARAGVGHLVVTHVRPSLDAAVSLVEAASRFDGPVDLAVPGMEVTV